VSACTVTPIVVAVLAADAFPIGPDWMRACRSVLLLPRGDPRKQALLTRGLPRERTASTAKTIQMIIIL
jgi:hypothetical protein